jgi:IclR family mhp operon transcriptional activator
MRTIRALDRGLEVLLHVSGAGSASLQALHRATGTPKPTLLRILRTLEARGMVWRRIGDGHYCASHHLTSRARYVQQTERLVQAASPVLDKLCAKTLWPSDLAIPRRDCMEICDTNRPLAPIHLNRALVGLRIPMLLTAHGRAYLSFCDDDRRDAILARLRKTRASVEAMVAETRARGYATRAPGYRGSLRGDGLLAIAVPVSSGAQVVGTVNIVWVERVATVQQMAQRHLEDLRTAASAIGDNLRAG